MNDLLLPARLQAALGDAFLLERELGGGGMSRLFVATERSLNRQVVIKVLPPELASEVSAARFKKEIEVVAQLQHPHIVPILSAGSGDDLLWYVMPYVRGESLRHRLKESGKLPVRDAVRILIEVADALAYAHRKGIVHRDIKPENILLGEGHAVLADFGIARALVAARTASGMEGANLTGTGMSVGTPTYMSPEQAAGESNVDARADIYALGLVGYEMLSGQHPFGGSTSVQSMIVSHLTEPAPPVAKLRPDTPPAVNAAIARALAKKPEERFDTAEQFRDALEGAPPGSARGSRAPLFAIGAALLAVLAIGSIYFARRGRTGPLDTNLIAVAPFDVVDNDLKLWHEGMVDVLSRNLDGAGPLRTVSPTLVVRRWAGRADKESATSLGKATGARLAVFGSLIRSGGDSVRGSASIVDASSGRVLGEVERRDAMSRMDRLSDSLTIGLLRELGKTRALSGAQMSNVGTTSLAALKAFLQGEQYFRKSAWDSALVSYERAIAEDSTFSIALSRDGITHGWVGGASDTMAIRNLLSAAKFNRGLAPRDSLLVVIGGQFARLGLSPDVPPMSELTSVFATAHEGIRRYPNDPEMWFALGDLQYHYGYGPQVGVPETEVVRSFDKAIALDSSFTPAYIHAIEMAFRYGTANGRRYLAAYLAQNPTDVDAEGMHLAWRLTDPALAGTEETRRALDTASFDELQHGAVGLIEWADSGETVVRIARMIHDQSLGPSARFDSARAARRFSSALALRGHARESLAVRRTDETLSLAMVAGETPLPAADSALRKGLAKGQGCGPCIVSFWGMLGDTSSIQYVLHLGDSVAKLPHPPADPALIRHTMAVGHAYLTLARHDSAGALREFNAIPDSLCHSCGWSFLTKAQLLSALGRNAEAAAVLDELGVFNSPVGTLSEFERARIAEKLGDKARARDGYAQVAGMWQHGDPFFKRYADEASAGLKRLSGENGATQIPLNKKP